MPDADKIFDEALGQVADLLEQETVGSCTCDVKTPEVERHDAKCRYRILRQAAQRIRDFVAVQAGSRD